jgi:hypothetical protein
MHGMFATIRFRVFFSSCLLSRNVKVNVYKIIILSVVLHGCETCPVILMEEHKLRVFEHRVLKRIFRTKRDETMGEWRKLDSEELHNFELILKYH